jgi:hypothetical protein
MVRVTAVFLQFGCSLDASMSLLNAEMWIKAGVCNVTFTIVCQANTKVLNAGLALGA